MWALSACLSDVSDGFFVTKRFSAFRGMTAVHLGVGRCWFGHRDGTLRLNGDSFLLVEWTFQVLCGHSRRRLPGAQIQDLGTG